MIARPFLARRERFAIVGSTNDVVRSWLAEGEPEVCLAIADEQATGRGREGRTWTAPAGRAALLSLGFRPTWLPPDLVWRLAAVTSLAMAEAAEEATGLSPGSIRLKWPNDLVVERTGSGEIGKLAGLLGETDGLGSDDPRAVVGIGVNGDWPVAEFPAPLVASMTSLRELGGGRPIDHAGLIDAFLGRLEAGIGALRDGRFDAAGWAGRQLTNGRSVRLEGRDGQARVVRAVGVDPAAGGLVVAPLDASAPEEMIISGEIHHLRLDGQV